MTQTNSTSHAASRLHSKKKIGPGTALFAGFGALLTLMGIIAVDSFRTLKMIEASDALVRRDFQLRQSALEQVQSGLYESSNIVRDYFFVEATRKTPEMARVQLRSLREEMHKPLNACIQSLPTVEKGPFQHLSEELDHYWSSVDSIFEEDDKEFPKQNIAFLRDRVLSQHDSVLRIAKDVTAINKVQLKAAEGRIAAVYLQFRRRLLLATSTILGFGVILAAITILYVARLEKIAAEKYDESLRAQRELKELSKRLVDAQEQERRAISRELHDEVGQSLSALLMDVENLSTEHAENHVFRNGLKDIRAIAENCVNEVRNMALLLRPSMLDDFGLVAALEWQAREVSRRTGMAVTVDAANVSDNLPEEHKTSVYRIVQEALNNASKHAYAGNVRVTLREEQEHLKLVIEDDGQGFDSNRATGLGLVGMKERVAQLGGELQVDSVPGLGTTLHVDLPFTLESGEQAR